MWPQQRYSGAHTGYHPTARGPRTGLEEQWRFDDRPTVDPVVSDGIVYVVGESSGSDGYHDVLHALDAIDGGVQWSIDLEERPETLAIDERRIYAGGDSIRAYSRADGSLEWILPIETNTSSEEGGLALVGRHLYTTGEETVYGIDAASGTVDWQRTLGGRLTPPAAKGRCVYVGRVAGDRGLDRTVFALGARTGRVRWSHDLVPPSASEANLVGPPVVADGRIYLRTTAGGEEDVLRAPIFGLVSLDRATGGDERTISSTYAGFDLHPIAAGGGRIYTTAVDFTSVSGLAVRDSNGTGGWTIYGDDGGVHVSTAPTVADGVLYVGSDASRFGIETDGLYAIDAATGAVLATLDLAVTSAPVVADGTVYVRSEEGLHAIGEPTTAV
ncbi:outer membrane protein assembly factor BamB family protein [Halalkalicoccus jeotgali]|uniref:Cell surface protein/ lipoprotein n=1 Tax=Halalkalicoccus jeotgali (strain DSM 18796 / CECT 7217 / JCM 14584 / KCTC 4019 / B3) TaxID=795797 RepID=D8J7G9_HALJB|nr:PQQ-binding-like beta-propeller repeat protein [Halalkalicoccus jeotgali]ADJ14064.1 cell surface protein/ lipoprotein [Halalkalicoccus jeotgali B3]ELY33892.1 cell surface protein/ lipoprotein [Halalkalicoccus jeotgali B3]